MSADAPDRDAPWWRGAAIYQIYPRSFQDTDGDGVGDLPGITARLEHVASLGVDAIWLSPFFPSPMADFGYDVSDYRGVDPLFGTLADFDALVARAHALGLKVVIDQVYAHTSIAHPWFAESRADRGNDKADWYVWADAKPDGTPPSNWQSVFGGPAWTWDARRRQYYLHNFLPAQPQLNAHHPAVQEALLDVARFWVERGVDGFRLDAINFLMHDRRLRDNPPAPPLPGRERTRPFDYQLCIRNQSDPAIVPFLERLRALTDRHGAIFTVAEIGGPRALPEMRAYTRRPGRLDSAYGFDFLYADALTPALVAKAMGAWPDRGSTGWPSWAFENHDAPRAVSRWATPEHAAAFARVKLLLLACLRGNVFVYQGEELGLPQAQIAFEDLRDPEAIANWPLTLGRDGARTPMPWQAAAPAAGFSTGKPWLPVPDAHRALAVDGQEADADSLLAFARRVLGYRRDEPALRHGRWRTIAATDALLVAERRLGDRRRLCAFNLSADPVAWRPAGGTRHWRIVLACGGATLDRLPPFAGCIAEPS